jgi:hypothetical protein
MTPNGANCVIGLTRNNFRDLKINFNSVKHRSTRWGFAWVPGSLVQPQPWLPCRGHEKAS